MTSEQINPDRRGTVEYWLSEIAYQLAGMNERNANEKMALNVALCATDDAIPVFIRS